MNGVFTQAYGSICNGTSYVYNGVANACHQIFQPIGRAWKKLNECRSITDVFQKTFQIGAASIQAYNLYYGRNRLSKMTVSFINTSNMHNFLNFLKIPYNYVYDIRADTVDAQRLADAIAEQLRDPERALPAEIVNLSAIIARALVETRLREMAEAGTPHKMNLDHFAYADANAFLTAFQARLSSQVFLTKVSAHLGGQAPANLDAALASLNINRITQIHLKSATLFNRISNAIFTCVDIGCISMYLKEWDIHLSTGIVKLADSIGLGEKARALGQTKVCQWLGKQDIGLWVAGGCCVAFGLKLIEAARQIHDNWNYMTYDQVANRVWDIAASAFEIAFCGAAFLKLHPMTAALLTISAKTIGIISILAHKPEPFFN